LTVFSNYCHLRPWEEVLGPVHSVEEVDGQCLALIGKIPVILPQELACRLSEAKGQRVGVLRTDNDYRLRVITPTNHAIDVGSSPTSIAQDAT
jgi:hypothetical protein